MIKKNILNLLNDLKNGVVVYDNATSGLTSTDVKNAIDELKTYVDNMTLDSLSTQIINIELSSWVLNAGTNLYETTINHTLGSEKIIYQAYSNKKEVEVALEIISNSELKLSSKTNTIIEIRLIKLDGLVTQEISPITITNPISILPITLNANDFTVDANDNVFYNATVTHNLGDKDIVNVRALTDTPLWSIYNKIDSNSFTLTIAGNPTGDVKVEIVHENK